MCTAPMYKSSINNPYQQHNMPQEQLHPAKTFWSNLCVTPLYTAQLNAVPAGQTIWHRGPKLCYVYLRQLLQLQEFLMNPIQSRNLVLPNPGQSWARCKPGPCWRSSSLAAHKQCKRFTACTKPNKEHQHMGQCIGYKRTPVHSNTQQQPARDTQLHKGIHSPLEKHASRYMRPRTSRPVLAAQPRNPQQ
jgi:hypothetical protein